VPKPKPKLSGGVAGTLSWPLVFLASGAGARAGDGDEVCVCGDGEEACVRGDVGSTRGHALFELVDAMQGNCMCRLSRPSISDRRASISPSFVTAPPPTCLLLGEVAPCWKCQGTFGRCSHESGASSAF
jgi:hypothetical protein